MEQATLNQAPAVEDAVRALRGVFEFAPVGIAQFDTAGRFLMVNQRLCSIFGYAREELVSRTFQEITFPDDLPGCLQLTTDLACGKLARYRHDKRFVRRDGSVVWVCVTVGAVRDDAGGLAFFVGMAEDVTDEHESEQRRRVAEERLEAALAASSTGTFRWDIVTGQLWWDPNLYRLMGLERRDGGLTVESSMANVHPDDLEGLARAVERCGLEGGSFKQEFRIVRHGEVRCLRCMGRALPGADGKPSHMTGAVTDITDAWQDRLQIEAARAAAEKASRMRDDMVAVVAHDLRNPVHTIRMAASLLQQPEVTAEQRAHLLRTVSRTVSGMERLLNDLLDVSRMDAGTFAVARAPMRVRELFDTVCEHFEVKAREKGVALACDLGPDIREMHADQDRMVQVLCNLVGNALKFARPPGPVSLEARAVDEGVLFTVRDNGPGIAAEDLPRLFDRFWQRDPAAAGGAGLGLAIAKGIVEAHAGRIWVESAPGATAFHFTVPPP